MPMPISNGEVNVGDPMAVVADNTIGVYEGISSTGKLIFRKDSDATLLITVAPAGYRLITAAEKVTRDEASVLAAAQAANDAAAAALTTAGGDPCP